MAEVVLARRARRSLLELDRAQIDAIEHALAMLEWDPLAGRALTGGLRGARSLRYGAFRILYHMADEGQTVRVAAVRHREASYRAGR